MREVRLIRIDLPARIVLAAVFLAAGALKIADPMAFAVSLARLRILPGAAIGPVAILLPWIEVVAAAALFVPSLRDAALKLLLGLLGAFTLILLAAIARGTGSACGCFGSGDGFLHRTDVALVRNVILIALAAVLLRRRPTSPAGPASPASGTGR